MVRRCWESSGPVQIECRGASGTGESGARRPKRGGALQEIARALFVRTRVQSSKQCTSEGSTAAAGCESIIADREHRTQTAIAQRSVSPALLPHSPLLRYSGRQGSFL